MRAWVAGAVAASALASGMTVGGVVAAAAADNFPTRALTIIVPWPPGASNDLSARAIANQMSQVLGQSIIVDNVGGAAGSRGSTAGARAAPDGYTLTFGNTTSHATNLVSFANLPYHPIDDFEPIGLVHRSTMTVAVNKDTDIHTLDDLIAYLKANPSTAYATREPVGVVAVITPWNAPLLMALKKVSAALAAGCPVILKPAELAPLSAFRLAHWVQRAGFPAGAFQVLPGLGHDAGQCLIDHPGVQLVSFTGSTATGRKIVAASAAGNLKRFVLEVDSSSLAWAVKMVAKG